MPAAPFCPSTQLPPLRSLPSLPKSQILSAVRILTTLYCSLPTSLELKFSQGSDISKPAFKIQSYQADSGYATGAEEDEEEDGNDDDSPSRQNLKVLKENPFEFAFLERWLTGFIARADELDCFGSEETYQAALDQVCCVLESLHSDEHTTAEVNDHDQTQYLREFSFSLTSSRSNNSAFSVDVRLNDGLAGTSSSDCTDVGLQSWGASILFSELLCTEPERFRLDTNTLGTSPQIVELGAGTGLVSLVLGSMLPRIGVSSPTIIATDYHPTVMANLKSNIEINFPRGGPSPVEDCFLDWSAPSLDAPLNVPANMLLATDVVYAPEHAMWLLNCASQLLAPDGVFWLVATVRQNGRFESIGNTVEAAFTDTNRPCGIDGKRLEIIDVEWVGKKRGVGRGDESGYKMFRIEWA